MVLCWILGGGAGCEEFLYNPDFLLLTLCMSETIDRALTAWPVVVAISLSDLNTPGTVRGEGLNIVG